MGFLRLCIRVASADETWTICPSSAVRIEGRGEGSTGEVKRFDRDRKELVT